MVLPYLQIQECTVALMITSLQCDERVCHLRGPGNNFPNLIQGGGHMSPVQVAVGNRARPSEGGGLQRPRGEEIWGETCDQVVDIL
jgi:hypothetical protein